LSLVALLQIYLLATSGNIGFIYNYLFGNQWGGATQLSKNINPFVATPYGTLSTLIGSSIILLFFILGLAYLCQSKNHPLSIYLSVFIFSTVFYFPNPLNMFEVFMNVLSIYRYREMAVPLIIIVAFIGLFWTLKRTSPKVTVLIFTILLLTSVTALANDQYSRDNPIMKTDVSSNFVTNSEYSAVSFAMVYTPERLSADQAIDDLIRERNYHSVRNSKQSEIIYPDSLESLQNTTTIIRLAEMKRRGNLLLARQKVDNARTINRTIISGNEIYDAGSTTIIS
jgi:hypothetical protein